jgi:ankyrin repeat protein
VKDNYGNTPLMTAAIRDSMEMTELLINAGADINATNNYGHTALLLSTIGNSTGACQLLLKANANVDAKDKSGNTALMYASLYGSMENMQLLIDSGADVNVKNESGLSVLQLARERKNTDAVKLLVKSGANAKATSVLSYIKKEDVEKILESGLQLLNATIQLVGSASMNSNIPSSVSTYSDETSVNTSTNTTVVSPVVTNESNSSSSSRNGKQSKSTTSQGARPNYTGSKCRLTIDNNSRDYTDYHSNCVITGVIIQDTLNKNHTLYSNTHLHIKNVKNHAVHSETFYFNTNELYKENRIKVTVYIVEENGHRLTKDVVLSIPSDRSTNRHLWWEGNKLH